MANGKPGPRSMVPEGMTYYKFKKRQQDPTWLAQMEKNRLRAREWQRLLRRDHPEQVMLNSARQRAREYGCEFDLTVEDIVIPEECPILRVPMVHGTLTGPSLDRVHPDRGYVRGNVAVMSRTANRMKQNATPEVLRRLADFVEGFLAECSNL